MSNLSLRYRGLADLPSVAQDVMLSWSASFLSDRYAQTPTEALLYCKCRKRVNVLELGLYKFFILFVYKPECYAYRNHSNFKLYVPFRIS